MAMKITLITFFVQILIGFAAAEFRLHKEVGWGGETVTLTYSDDCVDLPKEWAYKAKCAVQTDGCVTLWSEFGCKGEYRHIYPGSFGHYSLGELLFSERTASYQRCDTPKHGLLKELSPIYSLSVKHGENFGGSSQYLFYSSGCRSDLKALGWQRSITSIDPYTHCVAVYTKENCAGDVQYIVTWSPSRNNLADVGFDKKIESFGSCDLYYKPSCKSCPKSIYKGSLEYEFWIYLFSIFSREYRDAFESRVKQRPNGQISWNFMFAPNNAASRPGDQYQDVLYTQIELFHRLKHARVGYLNFNAANIDILRVMATRLLNEKKKQTTRFAENWNDHDFVIHKQLVRTWEKMVSPLEDVYKRWHFPENEDCGKPIMEMGQTTGLINDGTIAKYGEDPWHVAIYRIIKRGSLYVLICGGTLVSPTIVISAAHCFYDENRKKAVNKTSDYEIYVGKYTRDYFTEDSATDQKAYKIRELAFDPNGGFNSKVTGHYGSDIIVITLETAVSMNSHVLPICLDWEVSNIAFNPPKGTKGRIVGWGEDDQKDGGSDVLLAASLPFISYKDCYGKVAHVTKDKFCGGYEKGQGARRGDSGGGYVFEYDGRFYLRGIVSTKDREGTSSISTFTDVSQYLDWIRGFF